MDRLQICKELDRLGIKYSKFTLTKNLEKLLPMNILVTKKSVQSNITNVIEATSAIVPDEVVKTKDEKPGNAQSELLEIISSLAENVRKLTEENHLITKNLDSLVGDVERLKSQETKPDEPVKTSIMDVSGFNLVPPTAEMFPRIPRDLENVALDVLGDKFKFECEPMTDQPAFLFTVIVPKEYTKLKDEVDRRCKVVPNSLGANGVKDWCQLVKQNVVKHLGTQINVKS